jgi:4a-hydroxytetrahydrobiopterin dehydratase
MERLDDQAIESGLAPLAWERDGDAIVRFVTLADFKAAMAFINQVADLAESANHHPDMAISWNKVELRLSTHDAGGITARDLELAEAIDRLG